MPESPRRSIYVPEHEWQGWQQHARERSASLGESLSVSAMIRDAVNAAVAGYGRGDEQNVTKERDEVQAPQLPHGGTRASAPSAARAGEAHAGQGSRRSSPARGGTDGGVVDEQEARTHASAHETSGILPVGSAGRRRSYSVAQPQPPQEGEALEYGGAATARNLPSRRPFLKQDQIRKPKK